MLPDMYGAQNSLTQSLKMSFDTARKFCSPYALGCRAKFHKTASVQKKIFVSSQDYFWVLDIISTIKKKTFDTHIAMFLPLQAGALYAL